LQSSFFFFCRFDLGWFGLFGGACLEAEIETDSSYSSAVSLNSNQFKGKTRNRL